MSSPLEYLEINKKTLRITLLDFESNMINKGYMSLNCMSWNEFQRAGFMWSTVKYYLFALQNANTCEANQADYSHKGIFIDKEDSLCQHSSSAMLSFTPKIISEMDFLLLETE